MFDFIEQQPNGFTHKRRTPSALHGERTVVYAAVVDVAEEVVPAMDAQTHSALAPALYNEPLFPAVGCTRSVISAHAAGGGPALTDSVPKLGAMVSRLALRLWAGEDSNPRLTDYEDGRRGSAHPPAALDGGVRVAQVLLETLSSGDVSRDGLER